MNKTLLMTVFVSLGLVGCSEEAPTMNHDKHSDSHQESTCDHKDGKKCDKHGTENHEAGKCDHKKGESCEKCGKDKAGKCNHKEGKSCTKCDKEKAGKCDHKKGKTCAKCDKEKISNGDVTDLIKNQTVYQPYTAEKFAETKGKKKMAVFFYADWCGTCKNWEKTMLSHISHLPADAVILKANYDSEKDLAKELKVVSQSSVVFFDASGKITKTVLDPKMPVMKEFFTK